MRAADPIKMQDKMQCALKRGKANIEKSTPKWGTSPLKNDAIYPQKQKRLSTIAPYRPFHVVFLMKMAAAEKPKCCGMVRKLFLS